MPPEEVQVIKSGNDSITISKTMNGWSWEVKCYDNHPSGRSIQNRADEYVSYAEEKYPVTLKIKEK